MFLDWRGYLACLILVALATTLKYFTQPDLIPAANSLPYILAIVITAVYFGLGPSILASVLSVVAYQFYFVEPFGQLFMNWVENLPNLVMFLLVGIIVSFLAASLHSKTQEAEQLTRKLILAQEEEKKRIARELHDDTSPSLALLGLELDALTEKNTTLPPEVVWKLKAVKSKLDATQENIRHFSYELHPSILDRLGLEPALESLIDEVSSKSQFRISFKVTGIERELPDDVELALYRIAQEALNNVRKHSQATEAVVSLQYVPLKVILSIADNGTGFAPDAQFKGGLGLSSMKERANLIEAKLRIESLVGRGTVVIVEVQA